MKFGPVVQEEMPFNGALLFSGACNFGRGYYEENSVKLF